MEPDRWDDDMKNTLRVKEQRGRLELVCRRHFKWDCNAIEVDRADIAVIVSRTASNDVSWGTSVNSSKCMG